MQQWMALLCSVVGTLSVFWWWRWEPHQHISIAALGLPSMLLGAWAWAVWSYCRAMPRRSAQQEPNLAHDPVTGTLSHSVIHRVLEQRSQQALQHQQPLALLRLDIDRFSLLNATYGHDAGDRVLRRVAQTLQQLLPDSALVGRYDADEFLILLPHTERAQALTIAHHLRERIQRDVLLQGRHGQAVPLTVSIGVACLPEDAVDVPQWLAAAQQALLLAQRNGEGVADSRSSGRTRYRFSEEGTFSTLEALVTAIDHKDHYTRRHSEQVAEFALWIAEELHLPEEQRQLLHLAGLVHDVGKIGIPDEVLMKPDLLTTEEYETMKQHALIGASMVAALPGLEPLVPLVRSHHERWDGEGYPDGLAGEEIPFLARVLAVADAFSAMTTDRPYRQGMSWQSALLELQRQRGKQFDPVVVDAFVTAVFKRQAREQELTPQLVAAA